MSFKVLDDLCIGCGACDFSCPTGALTKTDSFLGLFVIDPYLCDDCAICPDKCPVGAIVSDPGWPVCHGRGCPLTSRRLGDYECVVWQSRCPNCGATLWRSPGGTLACSRCDLHMKVSCPKVRHLGAESVTLTPGSS